MIALAAVGVALVAGAPQASAQSGTADTEMAQLLRRLAGEVRQLRLEVLELRQESQEVRMPELERDLLSVQAEQQRLEQLMSVHYQEIVSLERLLARPGLAPEEMQELMARKSELAVEASERLRAEKSSLAQREAAVRERLERQQQRVRTALARSSELRSQN